MKVFVVDIMKCLDLPHFEPFFYENIQEDNLALFNRRLSSIDELDKVYEWLQEEINRSPFSITKGLVVFFIPRNLIKQLSLSDIDLIVKTYIYQKIARNLDNRFTYVCFFLDRTDSMGQNSDAYKRIDEESVDFCTEDPVFLNGKFPRSMLKEQLTFEQIRQKIVAVSAPTLRDYYNEMLDQTIRTSIGDDRNQNVNAFFTHCANTPPLIQSIKVPHFGADIAEKTKGLLKLVAYVCDMARNGTDDNFDQIISDFVDIDHFNQYQLDYDHIKKVIATYRFRLNNWLDEHPSYSSNEQIKIECIRYTPTDYAGSYNAEIDELAFDQAFQDTKNLSFRGLSSFELTDTVFRRIDEMLSKSTQKLRRFSDQVIGHMRDFCSQHKIFVTEPSLSPFYTEQERSDAASYEKQLNRYVVNDLPGYPAEIKLRQELDVINNKIKDLGELVRRYTVKLFLGTFTFAFLSVFIFYLVSQYSVFMKEDTWWVFGMFNLIVAVVFFFGYFGIRRRYIKKAKKLLDEAKEKVRDFLRNYKSRAEEFENNVNKAMLYSCLTEQQNRLTVKRSEEKILAEKYQWHMLKIKAILKNTEYFASFIKDTLPAKESAVPKIDPFEKDASGSEFYQMKIFTNG